MFFFLMRQSQVCKMTILHTNVLLEKIRIKLFNWNKLNYSSKQIKSYENDPGTVKHAIFLTSRKAQVKCLKIAAF